MNCHAKPLTLQEVQVSSKGQGRGLAGHRGSRSPSGAAGGTGARGAPPPQPCNYLPSQVVLASAPSAPCRLPEKSACEDCSHPGVQGRGHEQRQSDRALPWAALVLAGLGLPWMVGRGLQEPRSPRERPSRCTEETGWVLAAPCPALESLRSPLRSGSSSWGHGSTSGLGETLRQLCMKRVSLDFCTLALHPKGLSRSPRMNRGPREACGPTTALAPP